MTKSSKRPQPRTLSSRDLASVGGGYLVTFHVPDLSAFDSARREVDDDQTQVQFQLQ
jgi:hypothetical protein